MLASGVDITWTPNGIGMTFFKSPNNITNCSPANSLCIFTRKTFTYYLVEYTTIVKKWILYV